MQSDARTGSKLLTDRRLATFAVAGAVVGVATAFLVLIVQEQSSAPTVVISDAGSRMEIVVSVSGAVQRPGVYRLAANARLKDAIDAAGGVTADGDVSGLNLAARLRDEQQIVVPSRSHPAASPGAGTGPLPAADSVAELIDINSADASTLEALPGIGPALAERIIAYRVTNGPFARVDELARVEGISPEMVDDIRHLITAGP